MNTGNTRCEKPKEQFAHSRWVWIILLAVILFSASIRFRLLDIPLERDEGEHAYAAQVILDGCPPYAKVYNMVMPGVDIAYVLFMSVFGQSDKAIRLGLLIMNAASILMLFFLAECLFNPIVALTTASAFALLSLSQQVLGHSANAEHFVIFFVVAGILLLSRAVESQKKLTVFAAAFMLGTSFLMKQHGAVFILFAGLYLIFSELRRRPFDKKRFLSRFALFVVGVLLPFAGTCFVLWLCGVFRKFWFFTFQYNLSYVSSIPLLLGLKALKMQIGSVVGSAVLLWTLAGVGLVYVLFETKFQKQKIFVLGFLIFSFLAIWPGLYFRRHYFILLLPAVALFAGIGADYLWDLFARSGIKFTAKAVPVLLVLFVFVHTLYRQGKYFFVMSPIEISRITYGLNPFAESLQIAQFIKQNSNDNDRIAVIGSEPQIYFYADRRSATGYIYTYSMTENHPYAAQMQQEMIEEIEAVRPKFLVFINVPTSWMFRADSDKTIFDWYRDYYPKYYDEVGAVDMLSYDKTLFIWGPEAAGYVPVSSHWISVLKRKS